MVTGCVTISDFASLGITIGLKVCAITAGIKKYKSIINKKRKKYNEIVLLTRNKFNSIEVLIYIF